MADESNGALSASRLFEEEARVWESTGEIMRERTFSYGLAPLRLWLHSDGATKDGVSERLREYYWAAAQVLREKDEDWWDDLLSDRDSCSMCGETFRVENLSFCTHCTALLGYCHALTGGKAANGNPACPVCKNGEIVG
jgi:hypothetical protein